MDKFILVLALLALPVSAQSIDQGYAALRATNWSEAERIFRVVTSKESTNAFGWLGLARSLAQERRYHEALVSAERAAILNPTNVAIQFILGDCYYDVGQYQDAQAAYAEALKMRPSGVLHFWRGMSLKNLNRYAEAVKEFDQAPPNAATRRRWERLAASWFKSERYADALACYQKALALDPTSVKDLQHIGDCQYWLKDFNSAAASYRRCATAEPTNWEPKYWLGLSLKESGRYTQARLPLEDALALDGTNTEIIFDLADLFHDLKSYPQAENLFRRILQLDPDHIHPNTDFSAAMDLGSCLFDNENYLPAADAFREAAKFAPGSAKAHSLCAEALLRSGKFAEAVPEAAKARELEPSSREFKTDLLLLYLLTNQVRKADELFPVAYPTAMAGLFASVVSGLIYILKKSFRVSAAVEPSVGFSVLWLVLFEESQIACFLLGGLLKSHSNAGLLAAIVVGPLPLIIAAFAGFPSQPWGNAFQLPELHWKLLGKTCGGLLLFYCGSELYASGVSAIFHIHPPEQNNLPLISNLVSADPALGAVAAIIIAPLAEEILFRGLLFAALERRCGNWTILWTALAFGGLHLDLFYFIPITGLGLLLGWARKESGSIWLPTGIHCLNNAIAIMAISQNV